MQSYQLERTGNRPVTFTGELIAESSTHSTDGPASNRWWNLSLYKTESEKFALHIEYQTQWQGEHGRSDVSFRNSPEGLMKQLYLIEPEDAVIGYPLGQQYEDKQARLELILRQAWDKAVSELMDEFPEEI